MLLKVTMLNGIQLSHGTAFQKELVSQKKKTTNFRIFANCISFHIAVTTLFSD